MRIIILSGFLGAGKTSLLIQLAKYLATLPNEEGSQIAHALSVGSSPTKELDSGAPRVAILENEIGQVSVDSATLSSLVAYGTDEEGGAKGGTSGFALRELFSGCVCCSLTGEMIDMVRELQTTINPEWLIIEATGLAVPENAAKVLRERISDLQGLLTFVLIDAARFMVLEKISPLVAQQTTTANVLLLNKLDLVSDEVKLQVLERLSGLNENARVLEVVANKPIATTCFAEMIKDA